MTMYDEIRKYIREGKLEKAFAGIEKLELSRSQRDDLFLLESGYEEYLRTRLTESADFQQRTRNRLTRDTLSLVNLIEDSHASTTKVAAAPKAKGIAKKTLATVVITVALLLTTTTAFYYFWSADEPHKRENKLKVVIDPPKSKPPSKKTSPQAIAVPKLDVQGEGNQQSTSIYKGLVEFKKTVGLIYYSAGQPNSPDLSAAQVFASSLSAHTTDLTITALKQPKSFYSSTTLKQLKNDTYSSKEIKEVDVDYLLIIESNKTLIGEATSYTYRLVKTSTSESFKGTVYPSGDKAYAPKYIATEITKKIKQ